MSIQIKNVGWLDVNKQGGTHDGSFRVINTAGGGKLIVLQNGPNLTDGTVVKFDAAGVTAFTAADGAKHK